MVTINLFPWRQRQVFYLRKQWALIVILSIAVASVLLFGWHENLQMKETLLSQRITKLKQESLSLSAMPSRMILSGELQEKIIRANEVTQALFLALSQNKTGSVCFTKISREKDQMIFAGYTNAAIALTDYLKSWSVGSLFSQIVIDKLQENPRDKRLQFQFRAIESASLSSLISNRQKKQSPHDLALL